MAIPQYKILLLGDSGVGKTTTVRNILGKPAPPTTHDLEYTMEDLEPTPPTIRDLEYTMEDFDREIHEHFSTTTCDGHIPTLGVDVTPIYLGTDHGEVVANIWEVAGDPRYAGDGGAYSTRSDGAIVMCRESEMDSAERWTDICSTYGIRKVRTMDHNSNFLQVLGDMLGAIRSQEMGHVEVLAD